MAEYIRLTALVPAADAERAADALTLTTGVAASIEHPFAQPDVELDAVRVNGTAAVRTYLPAASARGDVRALVEHALAAARIHADVCVDAMADEDWAEAWKQHFGVERYGRRLVVVPSWCEFTPVPEDIVIMLDPGMAFGTGQHETTRMCLEALERAVAPGARVLDAGCGSGILAIAAAKLGARDVLALDIDADCVRITRENATANGIESIVHAEHANLADGLPSACTGEQFDLVVANIVAGVLTDASGLLRGALRPGGRLIASGVIASREGEVIEAFVRTGLRIEHTRAMGEWRCIEAIAP